MSAMSKAGIPIPRLLSFCDDPTVIGTEFYLMEFVNGAIYKVSGYIYIYNTIPYTTIIKLSYFVYPKSYGAY